MSEAGGRKLPSSDLEPGRVCATCGMDSREWSEAEGFGRNARLYCCRGCAHDCGCVCCYPLLPPFRSRATGPDGPLPESG